MAATASAVQTYWLLQATPNYLLLFFIFSSTVFLYLLHRLIGLQKINAYRSIQRFQMIHRFRRVVIGYAALAALGSAVTYFLLPSAIQWSMIVPAVLSFAYVLPFLTKGKRLRDIHGVKIFMVAAVWAWVSVLLPALDLHVWQSATIWWMVLERICFIFAITLAFDIRDLKIDQKTALNTLPAYLGIKGSKRLAWLLLFLMVGVVLINVWMGTYSYAVGIALVASAGSSGFLVQKATADRPDYYYTALLDGTIVLQLLLVSLALW